MGQRGWLLLLLWGCDDAAVTLAPDLPLDAATVDARPADAAAPDAARFKAIVATDQLEGDPATGYDVLINAPYVRCGLPMPLVRRISRAALSRMVGLPEREYPIEGRSPENAGLPYFLTQAQTYDGVAVANTNCLGCHAAPFRGELVIGLGNSLLDTTGNLGASAGAASMLLDDPADREALAQWAERMRAIGPFIWVNTVGITAADNLAAVLLGRRDPVTLRWQPDMQIDLPAELPIVPLATPPWWRMKKKHAMFYTGGFQGQHHRFMYAASSLCLQDVSEIPTLDAWFEHVRAYIESIEPPAWPFALDADLASDGERVFLANCARCHGTYGRDPSYPNLVIPLGEVGTDPALDTLTAVLAETVGPWVAATVWADTNQFVYTGGYMAPPLDGVWITAPFLHNDSVPDLASLLDSPTRPAYWRRDADPDNYDPDAVGYRHERLPQGKARGSAPENLRIYDTDQPGYSNAGHTYGDALDAAERRALLEYLKTL